MKRKIISIEAHDGDFSMIDIELDNNTVIMLTLKSKQNEPLIAEAIKEMLLPKTDGSRVFWLNGASLTLDEIIAMVRT